VDLNSHIIGHFTQLSEHRDGEDEKNHETGNPTEILNRNLPGGNPVHYELRLNEPMQYFQLTFFHKCKALSSTKHDIYVL
jgi:hypothetical protein